MQKKLSIITVNKNNIEGLRKTIESVICQTFTNYEYIVIDGASTDGSVDIIKQFAGKVAYWVSEIDIGVYNAMNKGIRKATGEYCLFLNSGDYLLTETVLSRFFACDITSDITAGNIIRNGKEVKTPDKLTIRNLLISNLPHQSEFIRRKLFDLIGLYDESYKLLSDFDFNMHCASQQVSYAHIDIAVANYAGGGISDSPQNGKIMFEEGERIISSYMSRAVYEDYKEMLNKKRCGHPAIRWVVNTKPVFKILKAIYLLSGDRKHRIYD